MDFILVRYFVLDIAKGFLPIVCNAAMVET